MKHNAPPISRAHRAWRGGAGAGIATLLAAASHALAGGDLTVPAIAVTALIALPLCTALAGRVGSLWRLTLGVTAAQLLYHWSFSELGAVRGSGAGGGSIAPAHTAHLAAIEAFAPATSVAAASATMWLMHGLAAGLTIALMHSGERAFIALMHLLRRACDHARIVPVDIPAKPQVSAAHARRVNTLERLFCAVQRRGPPAIA